MDSPFEVIMVICTAIIVVVVCGFGVIQPYFEAKAFNDCTGGHATYMTAVFTELRVIDCK